MPLGVTIAACVLAALGTTTAEPPAAAAHGGSAGHVYWADATNGIGRAEIDGSAADPSWIEGATNPRAVAIDGGHVYWAHEGDGGSIGRAGLDGSAPAQDFIAADGSPSGITMDGSRLFWTHANGGGGAIGAATVGGFGVNPTFVSTGPAPCGLATDGDEVYWAEGGNPGAIASAHGPFSVDPDFVTETDDPCGVAVAGEYLYWTNRGSDAIGRVRLTGGGVPDPDFVATGDAPCGVAADAGHIYWSTADGRIGRADLQGGEIEPAFVQGLGDVCGLAVTPTIEAQPPSGNFGTVTVGRQGPIRAFFIRDTSSTVSDVSGAELIGPGAPSFQVTGDGCTSNVSPPGSGCVINVRFEPVATGLQAATLRITGNAANSPMDIVLSGTGRPSPPRLLSAELRPREFPVGGGGRDPAFRFELSRPADVRFAILRARPGRMVGGECLAARGGDGSGACRHLRWVGRLESAGQEGPNALPFAGMIGGRVLRPGHYRARARVVGAEGRSRPRPIRFRLLPSGRG